MQLRAIEARHRAVLTLSAMAWASLAAGACSLSNIPVADCEQDLRCEVAFGLGSTCKDGFCTEPPPCVTGHDCRGRYGGGACVDGSCVRQIPDDPLGACQRIEPANLGSLDLVGAEAPVLVGGMFALDDGQDPRIADAAALAFSEINEVSGLDDGRPVGFVACDVGGPGNVLSGPERQARVRVVVDYLAGTLGVPFVVGPVTSGDAVNAISYALSRDYPTAFISPSATSPALATEPDRLDPDDLFGLFWRTVPNDELQGAVLAREVVGTYPAPETINRVAVIYINDAYGEGLANVFQTSFGLAETDLFPFGADVDFSQVTAQVAATSPDAMVMIAIDARRTVSFIREMANQPTLADKTLFLTDGSKDEAALLDPALESAVTDILFAQVVGTAPATPEGPAYEVFSANYTNRFDVDPSGFTFLANAYDAAYLGAAGTVYAATTVPAYDGRHVVSGLARLIVGDRVEVGKTNWGTLKSSVTSGDRTVDVAGISGELDFDPLVGDAPGVIEVWQPTTTGCAGGAPACFETITEVTP